MTTLKTAFALLLAASLGGLAGCTDNGSSSSSGTGTGTTGSTGTTGTTTGTSTSTSGSSGSSGTTGQTAVNGCDPATATDMTNQTSVTISYSSAAQGSVAALRYSPACVKISAGTQVTFQGATATDTFVVHPLTPGSNCTATPAGNPITAQSAGSSTSFTFANAGQFPFFCAVHCTLGMQGAIYVQ